MKYNLIPLAILMAPLAHAQDSIYGILSNRGNNTAQLIRVDTDGTSSVSYTVLHDMAGIDVANSLTGVNNALAYAGDVGAEGSLIWTWSDPASTAAYTYSYDIATGSVSTLGTITGIRASGYAITGGAWNSNPDLLGGVGYYIVENNTNRYYYLGDGSNLQSTTTLLMNGSGSRLYTYGDIDFTSDTMMATTQTGGASNSINGMYILTGDDSVRYLTGTYPGQLAFAGDNAYVIGNGANGNGVQLSKVDIDTGERTVIGSLIASGNYVINDMAGTTLATVPEPATGLLAAGGALLAFVRRRRPAAG